jgi:hypothetical protein
VTSFAALAMLKRHSQGTATTCEAGRRTRAIVARQKRPPRRCRLLTHNNSDGGETLSRTSVRRGA